MGAWVAKSLSVWLLVSAQVTISWFVSLSSKLGSVGTVQSLLGILFPSFFAPALLLLSLSCALSLTVNKNISFLIMKNNVLSFLLHSRDSLFLFSYLRERTPMTWGQGQWERETQTGSILSAEADPTTPGIRT